MSMYFKKIFTTLLLVTFIAVVFLSSSAIAEMKMMSDGELDEVTARQSLSEFTIEDNTARIFCDIC